MPATIAVIGGKIRVGLQPAELDRLARGDEPVHKLSRRGLALPQALQAGRRAAALAVASPAAVSPDLGPQIFESL